jgi:glycosyltransferase involved in cell wall biosynthesis
VSVVVPVLDEAPYLDEMVQRLRDQTMGDFEAIFADGGSRDGTRARLGELARADPRLRWVDNPRRLQSAGLNLAAAEVRAPYLVRLDARSFVEPDYLERVLEVLERTGADVVGGRMVARAGASLVERGIALANQAAWGAGPARFHRGGGAGPAETVYLGAFRTETVARLNGWAEDVGVNEDYELNHRIRRAGGTVWFDPALTVSYQPRRSLGSLARQYFRYGRSKAAVAVRHPSSLRPRQCLPALGIPGVVAATVAWGPVGPAGLLALHAAVLAAAASRAGASGGTVAGMGALAAMVMHWCWSAGFWYGMVRPFPPAAGQPARTVTAAG